MIQKSIPLTYTPKRLVKHPDQPYFYTIESDNNTLPQNFGHSCWSNQAL
jgi:splicing factor 3B subunit 3